jgi:hypothetical protein
MTRRPSERGLNAQFPGDDSFLWNGIDEDHPLGKSGFQPEKVVGTVRRMSIKVVEKGNRQSVC